MGARGSDSEEDQAWSYDGRRLPPLSYSEQLVVELKTWNEEIEKERENAKAMKRKFGGIGLGYENQQGAMLLDVWGADVEAGLGAVAEPPIKRTRSGA